MSKVEPIDEEQDYHDAETTSEAAAHYKDDDGSMENDHLDDNDKEAIDSKPILGSLNNLTGNDDADKANANVDKKQRRNSEDAANDAANNTNLNETEANDIDNKLGNFFEFYSFIQRLVNTCMLAINKSLSFPNFESNIIFFIKLAPATTSTQNGTSLFLFFLKNQTIFIINF